MKKQSAPFVSLRFRKIKIAVFTSLAITVSAAFATKPVIYVQDTENGQFLAANYKMLEDGFNHPRLQLLRKQENLDKVTASGKTQFEKILLLRKWTKDQWPTGGPFYYPPWDAVEILDLARKYKNHGFCAQYAIVFLQACQSMGLHARYVELPGHFIVGVWSDDYNKWIIMDPSADVHFEKNGIPLKGRELCHAYWKNEIEGIQKVDSIGNRSRVAKKDLEVFRMYSIIQSADQLSNPAHVKVKDGSFRKLVREDDFRKYPLIGREEVTIGSPYLAWKDSAARDFFTDKPSSDDPDDFRYNFNQTLLFVARKNDDKGMVKIVMYPENSPTFEKFEVKANEKDWQSTDMREIVWLMRPGENVIQARVRTKCGWVGKTSSMKIYYKPNLLKRA